jgi:hypothetical protein
VRNRARHSPGHVQHAGPADPARCAAVGAWARKGRGTCSSSMMPGARFRRCGPPRPDVPISSAATLAGETATGLKRSAQAFQKRKRSAQHTVRPVELENRRAARGPHASAVKSVFSCLAEPGRLLDQRQAYGNTACLCFLNRPTLTFSLAQPSGTRYLSLIFATQKHAPACHFCSLCFFHHTISHFLKLEFVLYSLCQEKYNSHFLRN